MAQKTLIFIPDISGFTKFVNETEITHSQHIISELLEIIINANQLNFRISEIEGDAVLFYRTGEPPNFNTLIEQAKKMFIQFHSHLRIIERDNVCQCGACTTASNLSLKFVTHFGELQLTKIHSYEKLIGRDIILAHRLLKNNILHKEYFLVTNDYLNQVKPINFKDDLLLLNHSSEQYDSFGNVPITYASFSNLLDIVPKPEKRDSPKFKTEPMLFNINILAPIDKVHHLLTDPAQKKHYTAGLKKVESDNKINRVNSGHVCYLDGMTITFTTIENSVKQDLIKYVEFAETSFGFSFTEEYILKEANSTTDLSVKLYPLESGNFDQKFVNEFFSNFNNILNDLKVYSEKSE